MKPKRLSRTVKYQSPWINLYTDRVEMPTGDVIEEYHVIESMREGVAAVVENSDRQILLIKSYRYVMDSLEWEVPAGGREDGESILETARREVREETGYDSTNHAHICSYNPMNSICTQIFHVVTCRADSIIGTFDENEVESCHWFSRQEIHNMIRMGQIRDGFSLTSLLLHLSNEGTPST